MSNKLGFIGERVGVDTQKNHLITALQSWNDSSKDVKQVVLYNVNLHAQQLKKEIQKQQPLEDKLLINGEKHLRTLARGYWRTGFVLLGCALGPIAWMYFRQQKALGILFDILGRVGAVKRDIGISIATESFLSILDNVHIIRSTLMGGVISSVVLTSAAVAFLVSSKSKTKRLNDHQNTTRKIQEDLNKLSIIVNSIISSPPSNAETVSVLISNLKSIPNFSVNNS